MWNVRRCYFCLLFEHNNYLKKSILKKNCIRIFAKFGQFFSTICVSSSSEHKIEAKHLPYSERPCKNQYITSWLMGWRNIYISSISCIKHTSLNRFDSKLLTGPQILRHLFMTVSIGLSAHFNTMKQTWKMFVCILLAMRLIYTCAAVSFSHFSLYTMCSFLLHSIPTIPLHVCVCAQT